MKGDKAGESQRWNQRSKGQRSRHLHKEVKEICVIEIIPNLENRQLENKVVGGEMW